jgi:hypothetical protein
MLYKLHAATYGVHFPNPDTLTMPFLMFPGTKQLPKIKMCFFHERTLPKTR